jgi:hypothetical protein
MSTLQSTPSTSMPIPVKSTQKQHSLLQDHLPHENPPVFSIRQFSFTTVGPIQSRSLVKKSLKKADQNPSTVSKFPTAKTISKVQLIPSFKLPFHSTKTILNPIPSSQPIPTTKKKLPTVSKLHLPVFDLESSKIDISKFETSTPLLNLAVRNTEKPILRHNRISSQVESPIIETSTLTSLPRKSELISQSFSHFEQSGLQISEQSSSVEKSELPTSKLKLISHFEQSGLPISEHSSPVYKSELPILPSKLPNKEPNEESKLMNSFDQSELNILQLALLFPGSKVSFM